jgi:capsular exopolysaccharide synthesis family protein
VDLRSLFQLLRDHWKVIVLVTVLAGAGSAALTARMTPRYASSVTLYVSAETNTTDPSMAYQGALLSQQAVQSYADLITGTRLAGSVVSDLGLPMTPPQLAAEISARPIPQTVLLTATVTDTSPGRAHLIAAAVGSQFVKLVSVLERPPGQRHSTVRVTVVAPATVPGSPVSPSPVRNVGIALALGLLAGIAFAAARRALDTTVKSTDQLAALTAGRPVLGTVPFDPAARKQPLIAGGDPFGTRAEAFRKIRTNLQFIDVDVPPKVLMFTSPLPEEGKSSATCNMAITLASSGSRVVVLEADLRRPRAAGYLGLPGGVGVTDVLAGTADADAAIQTWGNDEFDVLASGPKPPNPSDLLGSQRMSQLITKLRGEYDLVLLDAPPVLPFADAAATAAACDGVILVVRYGRTRVAQVRQACSALGAVGVPVLGSVLSMTAAGRHPEYGYGYRRYQPARDDRQALDGPAARDIPPARDDRQALDGPAARDIPPARDGPLARDDRPASDGPRARDDRQARDASPARDGPLARDVPAARDDVPVPGRPLGRAKPPAERQPDRRRASAPAPASRTAAKDETSIRGPA